LILHLNQANHSCFLDLALKKREKCVYQNRLVCLELIAGLTSVKQYLLIRSWLFRETVGGDRTVGDNVYFRTQSWDKRDQYHAKSQSSSAQNDCPAQHSGEF